MINVCVDADIWPMGNASERLDCKLQVKLMEG